MTFLHGQIDQRAGVGVIDIRQVQREAEQASRVVGIQCHDQFGLARLRAIHAIEVAMHLEPHYVLIQRVQRVAGRERNRADIAEVVHHHLQHLAFHRLGRRGVQAGEGEHGMAPGGAEKAALYRATCAGGRDDRWLPCLCVGANSRCSAPVGVPDHPVARSAGHQGCVPTSVGTIDDRY